MVEKAEASRQREAACGPEGEPSDHPRALIALAERTASRRSKGEMHGAPLTNLPVRFPQARQLA